MDDLEKAILFSFDQTGAVDFSLKSQALEYCNSVKASNGSWLTFLQRFVSSRYVEVQFWSLQSIEETVSSNSYSSLPDDHKSLLRNSLLSIAMASSTSSLHPVIVGSLSNTDTSPLLPRLPAMIKNKLAKVLVLLISCEYPFTWPSVFLDLLSSLHNQQFANNGSAGSNSGGHGSVDMFCRILNTLDEELISLDYPRTSNLTQVANRVKDGMRAQCLPQIVDTWHKFVTASDIVEPAVAISVLETMQRFIPWIDISLVANEMWIPLFFGILSSPNHCIAIKGAVADTLLAVVNKRMEPGLKLNLIRQLQLSHVCKGLVGLAAVDSDVRDSVEGLVIGYANQLLECGRVQDPKGSAEAMDFLEDILPHLLTFLHGRDDELSSISVQFLLGYISNLKKDGNVQLASQKEHLRKVMAVVCRGMRYREQSAASLDLGDKISAEEEERMFEYRRDLFTLAKNVARVAPSVSISFVHDSLMSALSNPASGFADVESVLALFYHLGECGAGSDLLAKPEEDGGNKMAAMLAAVLTSAIPHHSDRLVALTVMEIVVRYTRFVQQNPNFIPAVLRLFLGGNGMLHGSPPVASRACYLFARLAKTLRGQLLPFLPSILQSLDGTLAKITVTPSVSRTMSPGRTDGPTDERIYAFEALGLILSVEELPEDVMYKSLSSLVHPLCQQIDTVLTNQIPQEAKSAPPEQSFILLQTISALSYLSKGFTEHVATRSRPHAGQIFKDATLVVLTVLQRLPSDTAIQSKVISYLHRMVDTLGISIFPVLPSALPFLLQDCETKEIAEFVQFLNQLMNKFKRSMLPLLPDILFQLFTLLFASLPTESLLGELMAPTSVNEEQRERQELLRTYISLLLAVAANDLTDSLLSPPSKSLLPQILNWLLTISCSHSDITLRKNTMAVWGKLASDWYSVSSSVEEKVPGFRQFMVERFFLHCCILSVLPDSFDLKDADTYALLGELAQVQKVLCQKGGPKFLEQVATVVLPAFKCPPELAEKYCFHLQHSSLKDLKHFLKPLIIQLRATPNGSSSHQ